MRGATVFDDRVQAGRELAGAVRHLHSPDLIVVGLPRGGVPVAAEVADALGAPLDVILVRKLGLPFQPELAMGAIGESGVRVLNDLVIENGQVSDQEVAEVESRERAELDRRARIYRSRHPRQPLGGRTVMIIDDGVATGSTAQAACQVARAEGARRIILAVPVAPEDWTKLLRGEADQFVSLQTPRNFFGVGQFYRDFSPTTDDEVLQLLGPRPRDEDVRIAVDHTWLEGHLTVPVRAVALVIFAHGSGSSRHSPRNRVVASALNDAGLATLLFDLLTKDEEQSRSNTFDIDLLGRRLANVTRLVHDRPQLARLPVCYFGASTGAAAALRAAAEPGADISAIVSRGGRPDLAGESLSLVRAPTLLIVGGNDPVVLDLNRRAEESLRCPSRLDVIAGASHLFEEPGALRRVSDLAAEWFLAHVPAPTENNREAENDDACDKDTGSTSHVSGAPAVMTVDGTEGTPQSSVRGPTDIKPTDRAGMVVGVDGSPSSEAALRWATARTDLFGPITPVTEMVDAGPALVRHGQQTELIVVGCRGRRRALRSFQRSVSGHVVSHATVPVAVVPMDRANTSRKGPVIVGIDGSETSIDALAWAIRTTPPEVRLEVVHVWHHGINRLLDRRTTVPPVRVELGAMQVLDTSVEQARRRVGGSRRNIVTRLEYGEPQKILRQCSRDAGLLVLGSKGQNVIDRLFVGSVTSGLIHQPLVTTVVVPPSTRRETDAEARA